MDKSLILKDIKKYLRLKTDTDLASYLGITPQVLSNWKSRNAIDEKLIAEKCDFLNYDWILTGSGEMLKNNKTEIIITDSSQSEIDFLKREIQMVRELLKEKDRLIEKLEPLADQAIKELLERNKPNK